MIPEVHTAAGQNETPSVVYVLPDKMGGLFNFVQNLLKYRRADGLQYHSVLTDALFSVDIRSAESLPADSQRRCSHRMPRENLFSVLRRLARTIPKGPGVLVANDWIELAASAVYDSGRTLVNITHADSDYYYDLATKHQDIIDCFVTYTERMFGRLHELLPHRKESIFLIPYGVEIPSSTRSPKPGPLRLLYVGRLDRYKGVFDLVQIDARLRQMGVEVKWTMQGDGPDAEELKREWVTPSATVWNGIQPIEDVLRLYTQHDVIVMPCRSEGLPVALLEACAAGVVPVVTDLPSGIPEVVTRGVNGYRPAMGDIHGFAEAIAALDGNRAQLESMSGLARKRVVEKFDIRDRVVDYQHLYSRWRELRRCRAGGTLHYGSRMDKRWLPNGVVFSLRSARAFFGGGL